MYSRKITIHAQSYSFYKFCIYIFYKYAISINYIYEIYINYHD